MDKKYFFIAIAIILTSIISVSIHVFILQYFHAPEIEINSSLNPIIGIIIKFCTVITSIFIYLLSIQYWLSMKPIQRIILFALLIMALTESLFRSTIMNVLVGNSWQYQILQAIPTYLIFLSLSSFICLLAALALIKKTYQPLRIMLFAILATILFILVGNGAKALLAPLLPFIPNTELNAIQPPYGLNILIPAYVTYLEPTLASFILFYLIKEKLLPFNTLVKGLILGGIIAALHAGIYSIIQIVYSKGDLFYRIFYYGQFLWEYLALGILTAYSYTLFTKQLTCTNL